MKPIINRTRWSWIIFMIFIPFFLQGRTLTEQEVRSAVETWVRYVTADARPDAFIERMEPYQVDDQTVAYIAHLFGDGFCLCGANDLVLPVYLYCPKGTYDPSNPNYQHILWEIGSRLAMLQEGTSQKIEEYQKDLAERAVVWQDLKAGIAPEKIEQPESMAAAPYSMEIDFTPEWHQGAPYNDQCPVLPVPGANERTIVGCTATCISQIMYYWKWPNTGVDSKSGTYYYRWRNNWNETALSTNPGIPGGWNTRLAWTANNGGRLRMNGYWDASIYGAARNINNDTAYRNALESLYNQLTPASTNYTVNLGATSYNWNTMQDVHAAPPDAGDAEVAKLCFQVAVAIKTVFGTMGSGSDLWRTESPIENNFRYDTDAVYAPPNPNTIVEEIQWLRPVGFSGSGAPGGHAWILFGYNKGTSPWQYKMNMGWGWNYLNPPYGWYCLDNVPAGLNDNHRHLTQIAPQNVVKFVGNTSSGDGSPDNPYRDINQALQGVPNDGTLIFKAGSVNTFSGNSLVINKPVTLKGYNAVIQ